MPMMTISIGNGTQVSPNSSRRSKMKEFLAGPAPETSRLRRGDIWPRSDRQPRGFCTAAIAPQWWRHRSKSRATAMSSADRDYSRQLCSLLRLFANVCEKHQPLEACVQVTPGRRRAAPANSIECRYRPMRLCVVLVMRQQEQLSRDHDDICNVGKSCDHFGPSPKHYVWRPMTGIPMTRKKAPEARKKNKYTAVSPKSEKPRHENRISVGSDR
jgi:hypothetical protein